MTTVLSPMNRTGADRCPGVLRPFLADDGAIVRVRIPGGHVTLRTLRSLIVLAGSYAAPVLQFTTRGNLQMRGLPDPLPDAVVERVRDLALLPSPDHERVRNILAAPLPDPAVAATIATITAGLDAALISDPDLVALPGRFLWVVTDASGQLLREPWDIACQVLSPTAARILVAGHGLDIAPQDAVSAMIARAHAFLDARGDERTWNVRDLPASDPRAQQVVRAMTPVEVAGAAPLEPGVHGDDLVLGVPLGYLTARLLETLVDALGEDAELVITPWRQLVVPGGGRLADALAAAGFVTVPASAASRVSACPGAPYCRRTTCRTLSIATEAAHSLDSHLAGRDAPRVHVSGCERRCGHPQERFVDVVDPASASEVLRQVDADR